MERSGLFNSENGDRKYSAKAIARLVSMIMANGVFNNPANNLEVEAIENSMKVKINSGRAVINGYWYENTNEIGNELTLTLPSDSNGDVIYNIVLRLSNDDRLIRAYSVKGEPNKTPKAPILTRNDNVYEICLANVLIKEGQTFINQSDITDTRLDDRVCGITRRPFEKISTEEVFRQFQAWFNEQKDTYGVDLKKWQTEHKEEYSKFEEEQKKSFEDWFAKVVKILGENPNSNLINEMDKLRKDMANLVEIYKKETYKNIEQLKEMIKTDPEIIDIQAPVKSVNGKKGEVVLKAKDINCEDGKSIEENLKENKSSIEENNNKIKDLDANKIKLESSKFSSDTVEGGMEELFQNVDNGKKLIRGAIIDKDSKISIPTEPTFSDLKNGISNIKTGLINIEKPILNKVSIPAKEFRLDNKNSINTMNDIILYETDKNLSFVAIENENDNMAKEFLNINIRYSKIQLYLVSKKDNKQVEIYNNNNFKKNKTFASQDILGLYFIKENNRVIFILSFASAGVSGEDRGSRFFILDEMDLSEGFKITSNIRLDLSEHNDSYGIIEIKNGTYISAYQ